MFNWSESVPPWPAISIGFTKLLDIHIKTFPFLFYSIFPSIITLGFDIYILNMGRIHKGIMHILCKERKPKKLRRIRYVFSVVFFRAFARCFIQSRFIKFILKLLCEHIKCFLLWCISWAVFWKKFHKFSCSLQVIDKFNTIHLLA